MEDVENLGNQLSVSMCRSARAMISNCMISWKERVATYEARTSHTAWLLGSLNDSEILRLGHFGVVLLIDAVDTLLIVIISGDYAQIYMLNPLAKLRREVGEAS